jgi:hypothetical protein
METFRATVRVNVSMGLVVLSLIAELLFVLLVGYGLYRTAHLFL